MIKESKKGQFGITGSEMRRVQSLLEGNQFTNVYQLQKKLTVHSEQLTVTEEVYS
jgi:hypothetical protein